MLVDNITNQVKTCANSINAFLIINKDYKHELSK